MIMIDSCYSLFYTYFCIIVITVSCYYSSYSSLFHIYYTQHTHTLFIAHFVNIYKYIFSFSISVLFCSICCIFVCYFFFGSLFCSVLFDGFLFVIQLRLNYCILVYVKSLIISLIMIHFLIGNSIFVILLSAYLN